MTALTVFVTALTACIFLAAAWAKFAEHDRAVHTRDGLGIRPGVYRLIGVCEVAGAAGALIGLAVRPLGIAALAGLVLLAVGACAAHARLGGPPADAVPAVLALLLSAAALALQLVTA